jgi:hypothetical protein
MTETKLRSLFDAHDQRDLTRLHSPDWDGIGWEYHVPKPIAELWDELSDDAKLVAFYIALRDDFQDVR